MNLKINDIVMSLDDNLEGVVKQVIGSEVLVETLDGFELMFSVNELVVIPKKLEALKPLHVPQEVIKQKSNTAKKPVSKKHSKREIFTIEVDLHIEKLVDNLRGLSNFDILEIQLKMAQRSIEQAIRNKTPKLVLIHGVGEGILKNELTYLYRKYPNIVVQEANFQKYGLGATELYFEQKFKDSM